MTAQDNQPGTGDSQLCTTDSWDGWKPEWRGENREATPHALQERHAPTVPLGPRQAQVPLQPAPPQPIVRNLAAVQRRITDARLWGGMSGAQQDAAQEIAFAFEAMSQGLGFTTVNWQRLPGCRGANNAVECREKLLAVYVGWAQRCHAEGISHSMIIDVLVFGFACRALDRDRRVRSGWSRRNLLAGLSLYCRMKGWNPA